MFTYNEQDDVTLHYLSEFHGKKIIAAENYFSVDREVKSSISTDTIDADNTSGLYFNQLSVTGSILVS